MTNFEQAVLNRIRQTMKVRKVNQTELAEAIGSRQYSVSRMLSGAPFPSLDQMCKIAERLDVSLYYLLGVQEQSYRELSPEAAKVANAYQSADPIIKAVIERVLEL